MIQIIDKKYIGGETIKSTARMVNLGLQMIMLIMLITLQSRPGTVSLEILNPSIAMPTSKKN